MKVINGTNFTMSDEWINPHLPATFGPPALRPQYPLATIPQEQAPSEPESPPIKMPQINRPQLGGIIGGAEALMQRSAKKKDLQIQPNTTNWNFDPLNFIDDVNMPAKAGEIQVFTSSNKNVQSQNIAYKLHIYGYNIWVPQTDLVANYGSNPYQTRKNWNSWIFENGELLIQPSLKPWEKKVWQTLLTNGIIIQWDNDTDGDWNQVNGKVGT